MSGLTLRRTAAGLVLVALAVGLWMVPTETFAYTRETHYYLRFGLALATCFDYEESHLIASGDWMMDGNLSTHAEMTPFQKKNKIGFHAFGHSDARFNELWERTRAEPDLELRLIKLGQFMHFLEDWESHAGYGVALGHAKATFSGRDPDSLGGDRAKNHRMVQSALEHLLRTCSDIGRTGDASVPADVDYYLVWLMRLILENGLMDDLFEIGDPAWKKGRIKGIRKSHQEIRDRSLTRIEEFVEVLKDYPEKKVPDWFEAGDRATGIPLALQIRYNGNGDILTRPGAADPVEEVLARNRADREEEDLRVYIDSSRQTSVGFDVRLAAANVGGEPSDPGSIDVYVIDPDQEVELGRASVDLEGLGAGEQVDKRVTVRARTTPGKSVMIGALVRAPDYSALDNQAWLMSDEESTESADVPLVVDVDPDVPGRETLMFAQDPKMWVVDEEAFCVLVAASTSEGDPTEKLIDVQLEVITEAGDQIGEAEEFPRRWGASARAGLPHIAAKSFGCFEIGGTLCDSLGDLSPESVLARVTLEAPGMDAVQKDYPVPDDVLRAGQQLCSSGD